MVIQCQDVWQELSNYIDDQVDAPRHASLDAHFAGCRNCAALLEGTRNIVRLYGDERLFTLPPGYRARVLNKVADRIEGQRGGIGGWLMTLAAAAAMAAFFVAAQFPHSAAPPLRSAQSRPTLSTPAGFVVVAAEGKTYHVRGCSLLHGEGRLIPVAQAIQEGYSPCIHCMKKALLR